ncbi:hypothetical protein FRC03_008858 [Tulasnella sp. 419]|nr:hypothetical protein FRC03_008858 [Tulasnella sp. 419]
MEDSNDYEQRRAENIRKNQQLLAQLGLEATSNEVEALASSSKKGKTKARASSEAKPVQSKKPRVKKEQEEPVRRISTRLRRQQEETIDPNETPAQKRKREREVAERRAAEEAERLEAEQRALQAKRPRHQELHLTAIGDELPPAELNSLRTTLSTYCSEKHPRRVGSGSTSDDETIKSDARLDELKKKLQGVKVRSRAKLMRERIYSMAYHSEKTKDLIFIGDKTGQMGIWDALAPADEVEDDDGEVSAQDGEGGKYWTLQPHWPPTAKSSISCIKLDPIDSHSIFTSAYDCTMRHFSFTSGLSREIYHLEDTLLSSFDIVPGGNEIWVSDAAGGLSRIDLREDKDKARRWQLNERVTQKIGCVSINPVTPHFLVTASNERSLRIWDARKLVKLPISQPEEDNKDALNYPKTTEYEEVDKYLQSKKGPGLLRGTYVHGLSVSSAYWDPSGRRIVSTSYDDKLRVFAVNPSSLMLDMALKKFEPTAVAQHNCQTGRWVTVLKAQWMPSPDAYPHFTIANMNQSLDVFGYTGKRLASFSDRSKITAVQAVTASHPSVLGRYCTGNASGRCVLWRDEE